MRKHTINGHTFYEDKGGNWFVIDDGARLHIGTVGDIVPVGYRLRGFDLVQNYLRYLELPASTGDYECRDGYAI